MTSGYSSSRGWRTGKEQQQDPQLDRWNLLRFLGQKLLKALLLRRAGPLLTAHWVLHQETLVICPVERHYRFQQKLMLQVLADMLG